MLRVFCARTRIIQASTPAIPSAENVLLDVYCPACGYSLRGLDSARCPECGETFDPQTVRETSIPWAHRERIGRVRAFVKTCWFAGRRPTRLGREASRPQRYRDARHFQYVLTVVAFTPPAVAAGLLSKELADLVQTASIASVSPTTGLAQWNIGHDLLWCILAGLSLPIVATASVYALGFMLTSIHTYAFHPKHLPPERQNNAIAVGYYAVGPILYSIVPASTTIGLAFLLNALHYSYARGNRGDHWRCNLRGGH